MEGGNRLRINVVGCLTPSPCITKSSNPSLVQDLVFMHVLIKIIKPSRHRWPITPSISRWLVVTPNLVFSVPIAISTNMPKHTHTHTHLLIFTQYVHPSTHTQKARFCWAYWGSELGTKNQSRKMIFRRQHLLWEALGRPPQIRDLSPHVILSIF